MEKKYSKINEFNILWVTLQILLTIAVVVLAIIWIFIPSIAPVLEIVTAVDLFLMAFNNHRIYRREKVSKYYIIFGVVLLLMALFSILGVI